MKQKNKIYNVIMFVLIAVAVISSIMFAGNTRGWFGAENQSDNATVQSLTGVAMVERDGISFGLDADFVLRDGDIVTTNKNTELNIAAKRNTVTLNENSEVLVLQASGKNFGMDVRSGEVFLVVNDADDLAEVTFDENSLEINGTVLSLSVQTGSASVTAFSGEVAVATDGASDQAKSGQVLSLVQDEVSVHELSAASLNEFTIAQAIDAAEDNELCFSNDELTQVTEQRADEKQKALEEQAAREAEIIAQGGTEAKITTKKSTTNSGSDSSSSNEPVLTCTIQIRCDTILDNMDSLTEGKDKYVPSNGVILATSRVQFVEGETVFDILKRTCSYAGIQLEYSFTPMYDSYYIEGINHLYEFDCGSESGWMYKVDGWFPNYGCSKYELKDGDTIVWCYTCNGLGADVGGGVY